MKHKINDTKLRSLLMVVSGRALEISVGTFLISYLLLDNLPLSFGIAILNETICAITTYLNLRVWNKTSWGRKVIHERVRLGDVGE